MCELGSECQYGSFEDSGNDLGGASSGSVGPSATEGVKGPQICNDCTQPMVGYGHENICAGPLDPVNSPSHYRWLPVEAIEITELFNFRVGNALKYLLRHEHKGRPLEDLRKAKWYLEREIEQREQAETTST